MKQLRKFAEVAFITLRIVLGHLVSCADEVLWTTKYLLRGDLKALNERAKYI